MVKARIYKISDMKELEKNASVKGLSPLMYMRYNRFNYGLNIQEQLNIEGSGRTVEEHMDRLSRIERRKERILKYSAVAYIGAVGLALLLTAFNPNIDKVKQEEFEKWYAKNWGVMQLVYGH